MVNQRKIAASGQKLLKAGVSFADIVPAGSSEQRLPPGGGKQSRQAVEYRAAGSNDVGGVLGEALEAGLAFVVATLAVARRCSWDGGVVGKGFEGVFVFLARPAEGAGVAATGVSDEKNLAGRDAVGVAKFAPRAFEGVPMPERAFIFLGEFPELVDGDPDEFGALRSNCVKGIVGEISDYLNRRKS